MLGLVVIVLTLISGAWLVYHAVEGWGLLDSFYVAVVTISTIGYGDFSLQTPLGKIFTISYILIGLAVFVAAAGAIADSMITARKQWRKEEGRE